MTRREADCRKLFEQADRSSGAAALRRNQGHETQIFDELQGKGLSVVPSTPIGWKLKHSLWPTGQAERCEVSSDPLC